MKKLLKNSLLVSVLTIAPFTVLACQKQKPEPVIDIPAHKPAQINPVLNKIISKYVANDPVKKQSFLNDQNNINDAKFNELKYALAYYPIYFYNVEEKARDYKGLVTTSKQIVKNTFTRDWYWLLENLAKFDFVFNPYADTYIGLEEGTEVVKDAIDKNQIILEKIQSNFVDSLEIDLNFSDKIIPYNVYTQQKAIFLILNKNMAMKMFSYVDKDNQKHIFLLPDIYYFKDAKNINDLKSYLQKFQAAIEQQKQVKYQSDYEYTNNINDGNVDEEKFWSKRNDANYLKPFGEGGYNLMTGLTVQNIFKNQSSDNPDNLSIYRYSLRWVHEK